MLATGAVRLQLKKIRVRLLGIRVVGNVCQYEVQPDVEDSRSMGHLPASSSLERFCANTTSRAHALYTVHIFRGF